MAFAISTSPLICFGDVLRKPFAREYKPSSWVERGFNMLFPLCFQRGYNVSLNLGTIDRSDALWSRESWLLEEIPIRKKKKKTPKTVD